MQQIELARERLDHGIEMFVVSGQIDVATIMPLVQETDEAVDGGSYFLLFDLTALDFLDSSVLHLLERTRKRVEQLGGSVTVACAGPVARAFQITGLDRVFSVESTRAAAVARLIRAGAQG